MRLGLRYCRFALLLAVAILAGDGQSQTTTSGGLSGLVIDQTNAVIPDAVVEIKDECDQPKAGRKRVGSNIEKTDRVVSGESPELADGSD